LQIVQASTVHHKGAAIESLKSTLYRDGAQQILRRLRNEQTLLGVPELSKLMVSHPSVDVREEIEIYLTDIGYIGVN
jgi:hypothetical protein